MLLTVVVSGCAQSKSPKNNEQVRDFQNPNVTGPIKELPPNEITKECSSSEAESYRNLDKTVKDSDMAIDRSSGKKVTETVKLAQLAIKNCDKAEVSILNKACRRTYQDIVTRETKIDYYDSYRVLKKCKKTENYLLAHGERPEKNGSASLPTVPSAPTEPTAPVETEVLGQCSATEFSNLSTMASQLDKANSSIDSLGGKANWKYNSSTVSLASAATKTCETLINYHDSKPCEKEVRQDNGSLLKKQYTGLSLRARCEKSRSYYYDFVQNRTTLNFKNADLYLDISAFGTKYFEPNYVNVVMGCRVENKSSRAINYSNNNVLIKSSRGFEEKMMVLETPEGLLVQCYGLAIGDAFSKTEIVRLLKADGTNMPLNYKLK